jgi:hypothetical protein
MITKGNIFWAVTTRRHILEDSPLVLQSQMGLLYHPLMTDEYAALNGMISIYGSTVLCWTLDGGSARRRTATYTQDNTNTR